MVKRGKKGEILVENIIFIVLNVSFLAILAIFLINQGNGATFLEDSHAKQMALLIDSARPGMVMEINFKDAKGVAEKNGISFSDILTVKDNYVTVKLSENSEKSYHFFNDINISRLDADSETGFYTLTFSRKNEG